MRCLGVQSSDSPAHLLSPVPEALWELGIMVFLSRAELSLSDFLEGGRVWSWPWGQQLGGRKNAVCFIPRTTRP